MAKSQRRVSDGLRRAAGLGAVVIGGAGSLLLSGPFGLAAAAAAGAGAALIFAGPRAAAVTFDGGDGLDAVRNSHFDRVTGAGVWRTCLKTDEVYWDPRMREIFETSPEFETSRGLSSRFFTREGRRDFLDAIEATRQGGGPFDIEIQAVSARDRRLWLRIVAEGVFEADEMVRLDGLVIDVTARKREELEMRAKTEALSRALAERDHAQQRFFDIAATSSEWFWEQDADQRLTFISESYQRSTGGDPSVYIGKSRAELLAANPSARARADWAYLEEKFKNREQFSGFVYADFGSDEGRTRWLRISGAPFFDGAGAFAGYRGVGADISDLYEALRHAEAVSRQSTEAMQELERDLLPPLEEVIAGARALSAELSGDGAIAAQSLASAASSLSAALETALGGDVAVECASPETSFTATTVAERLRAVHADAASRRGVRIRIDAPDHDGSRTGDLPSALAALHGLAGHALQTCPDNVVRIDMEASPAGLAVRIGDMAEAQGGGALNEALTSARRLGGDVAILPRGSGFCAVKVTIPAPLAHAAPPVEVVETVEAEATPRRFLIADDNETNRLILELLLDRMGADTQAVADGRAAVEAAREGRFDAILMDIAMPEMDGAEAMKAIRAFEAEEGRRTPILAVTANALTHQIEGYLSAGFDDHVAKPIQFEALKASLAKLTEAPEPPAARVAAAI